MTAPTDRERALVDLARGAVNESLRIERYIADMATQNEAERKHAKWWIRTYGVPHLIEVLEEIAR